MMMPESEGVRDFAGNLFLSPSRQSLLFVGLSGEKGLLFKWMETDGEGGGQSSPGELKTASRMFVEIYEGVRFITLI